MGAHPLAARALVTAALLASTLASADAGRLRVCALSFQGPDEIRVAAWDGAAVGDEVVVFGRGRCGEETPTTLAEAIGTVGEEILCRLTPSVRREYR